jgi:hypothetical protein
MKRWASYWSMVDWPLWFYSFGLATCTGVIECDLAKVNQISEIDLDISERSDIEEIKPKRHPYLGLTIALNWLPGRTG